MLNPFKILFIFLHLQGGEPDPDHGNNSAHHEEAEKSNQILALVCTACATPHPADYNSIYPSFFFFKYLYSFALLSRNIAQHIFAPVEILTGYTSYILLLFGFAGNWRGGSIHLL